MAIHEGRKTPAHRDCFTPSNNKETPLSRTAISVTLADWREGSHGQIPKPSVINKPRVSASGPPLRGECNTSVPFLLTHQGTALVCLVCVCVLLGRLEGQEGWLWSVLNKQEWKPTCPTRLWSNLGRKHRSQDSSYNTLRRVYMQICYVYLIGLLRVVAGQVLPPPRVFLRGSARLVLDRNRYSFITFTIMENVINCVPRITIQ